MLLDFLCHSAFLGHLRLLRFLCCPYFVGRTSPCCSCVLCPLVWSSRCFILVHFEYLLTVARAQLRDSASNCLMKRQRTSIPPRCCVSFQAFKPGARFDLVLLSPTRRSCFVCVRVLSHLLDVVGLFLFSFLRVRATVVVPSLTVFFTNL